MKQKKQCGKNIRYRQAAVGVIIVLVACLLIFDSARVSAAAAALQSPAAVVYEAADEGSSPVGNLVQGNTFELNGSVTGADGSQWYSISMSNGSKGYIKGEISTGNEAFEAKPDPEEENGAAKENAGAEAVGGREDNQDQENAREEVAAEPDRPQITGTKKKTYAVRADAGRIRTQPQPEENGRQQDEGSSSLKRVGSQPDVTMAAALAAAFGSFLLIRYSLRRIKRTLSAMQKGAELTGKAWLEHGRTKKRRKVKQAKKKQAAKEAKKWKNNSLQKK